jgi:hypothetical protein
MYVYVTYIHTYRDTRTHTFIHTYIHTHVRTCIHSYIHAYIHSYIHTYIHMYVCTCAVPVDAGVGDGNTVLELVRLALRYAHVSKET